MNNLPTPAASQPTPVSAFAVHGIWSPGVLLMRAIDFKAKALIISLIFLLPVLLSGAFLVKTQQEQIHTAQQELVGLRYARDVLPVIQALQDLRKWNVRHAATGTEPPEAAQARQQVNAALMQLAKTDQALGQALQTGQAVQDLRVKVDALTAPAPGAPVAQVIEQYTQVIQVANQVLETVLDTSGLVLDPVIDTYYLMDAALLRLPLLTDSVANLRGIGVALSSGVPVDNQLQRHWDMNEGLGDYLDTAFENSVHKVVEVHPELAQQLDATQAIQAMHKLHESKDALFNPDPAARPNVSQVVELGNAAVAGFHKEQQVLLNTLDRLLAERISAQQMGLWLSLSAIALALLAATYLF